MFLAEIVVFILIMYLVISPVYAAYVFTRPPKFRISFRTPADWGVTAYESVTLTTKDGVDLDGWYVPSRNGAAVILLHGHSGNRLAMTYHAEALLKAGYGVLLYDLRAHGSSSGRVFTRGQDAPEDVLAGVTYLSKRADVNPGGIGVMGVSVGGLLALQAAVQTVVIRAVVADSPAPATPADLPRPRSLWDWVKRFRQLYYMRATGWFARVTPLPAIVDVAARMAPRPLLFISTGPGSEQAMVRRCYEAAGAGAYWWSIPEANHVNGWLARGDEYGHKLVTFFNLSLTRTDGKEVASSPATLAELFPVKPENEVRDGVAYEATVSLGAANLAALLLVPLAFGLFLGGYWLVWGNFLPLLGQLFEATRWWGAVAALAVGILVHEVIHVLGFLGVGRVPRTAVKIGFHWRALAPYAHCKAPMKASAYRVSVMLPGLVLGVLPAVVGLVSGGFGWVLYGVVMITAAGGDAAVLWAVRQVPAAALVRDHPSKPGCEVLTDSETSPL